MPSDALYMALAEALSKPSKSYRAAMAGLDIPNQALQGYISGSDIADKFRRRKLGQTSLEEMLGKTPKGYEDFSTATPEMISAFKSLPQFREPQSINFYSNNNGSLTPVATAPRGSQIVREEKPVAPPKPPAPDRSMDREIVKAKVSLAKTKPFVTSTVSEIERVEKLNKDSYGGAAGSLQMKTMSALNLGANDPKFQNTSDVVNTMQAQVARVLKSTFGGQLSDGERAYLNEVYGALPKLSQTERGIAMKNVKTMLRSKLEGEQQTLSELQGDSGMSEPAPMESVPDVGGTDQWQYATNAQGITLRTKDNWATFEPVSQNGR